VERLKPIYDALQANTLRWEVMSDARKVESKAAMVTKEKKQQKEHCDKDMTREEAAKLRGTSSNKRKASEDSNEGEGERPKRIKKAVMARMTDEEKTAHKRKMECERKARNRLAKAVKDGKEVKKRKRALSKDEGHGKAKKAPMSAKSKEIIDEEDDDDYEPPSNKGKAKAKANLSEDDDDKDEEGEELRESGGKWESKAAGNDEDDDETDADNEKASREGSCALPYTPKLSKKYIAINEAVQRGKKNKPPTSRPRHCSPASPPLASTSQLPPQTLAAIGNNDSDDEDGGDALS
jgi:hypothetical protein